MVVPIEATGLVMCAAAKSSAPVFISLIKRTDCTYSIGSTDRWCTLQSASRQPGGAVQRPHVGRSRIIACSVFLAGCGTPIYKDNRATHLLEYPHDVCL